MPGFIGIPELLLLGLVVLARLRPEAAARDGPLARQGNARVQGLDLERLRRAQFDDPGGAVTREREAA